MLLGGDKLRVKVVIAMNSFKGSLTAVEATAAVARGLRRRWPTAHLLEVPLADGGEGTVAALVATTGGRIHELEVTGPLGEPVRAGYGILGDGGTAVIEMAAAAGLPLVPPGRLDPGGATTFGVGQLVEAALEQGCTHIIMGIGGSATVDGGAGLAQALGARLLDAAGRPIPRGGLGLERLDRIDVGPLRARLSGVTLTVACDVDNPLCGPYGAAVVYGPQKGATPELAARLDAALCRYAAILKQELGADVLDLPGAGAAGGLGGGLVALAGARLRPGVDLVMEVTGLAAKLSGCRLVITGEGRLDAQTGHGK
ncbi:MAG TPA: glycerate kinase, partial [Clostridiales bacterium UBA8153]|nr:glycerate kinase [Clostridiales bacterium UBA8153]